MSRVLPRPFFSNEDFIVSFRDIRIRDSGIDHNSISNKDGGNLIDEFYHLSKKQFDLYTEFGLIYPDNNGINTIVNMLVTSGSLQGTEESYSFKIDDINFIKIYSESDGYGGLQNCSVLFNQKVEISSLEDRTQLTIKSSIDQENHLFLLTDSSNSNLAWISSGGKIHSNRGFRGSSVPWTDVISLWTQNEHVPDHQFTNSGNYDFSGHVYGESIFWDSTNSPFEESDLGKFITINNGEHKGAKARITGVINSSYVEIFSPGWDDDLTNISYSIYPHPTFIVSDHHNGAYLTGSDGSFYISSGISWKHPISTESMFKVYMDSGQENQDAITLIVNANGYSNVDAFDIIYDAGNLGSESFNQVFKISLNEVDTTGGHIDLLSLNTTNNGEVSKHAIHIGVGFDEALIVSGADSEDPEFGYEISSGIVIDRVNSAGAGNDAFINKNVNEPIFEKNGDYILIGSSSKFELIQVVLNTRSSKSISPVFYYSKAGGNWTPLSVDDRTLGFTLGGCISFYAPEDWTKDDQAQVDGDISEAYYIKIQRSVIGVIPTLPVELYFKTYSERSGDTGMEILGNGVIKLPYLSGAPDNLTNGYMWMECDGLHIYYASSEKVVAGI